MIIGTCQEPSGGVSGFGQFLSDNVHSRYYM